MKPIVIIPLLAALAAVPACAQSEEAFDQGLRDLAIDELAQTIDDEYFDEVRAAEIASMLRATYASGGFDGAENDDDFARILTGFLREEDRHFSVNYIGPQSDRNGDGGMHGTMEEHNASLRRANYGFEEVSILPGNIGYIRFNQFSDAEAGAATAIAALNFVSNTDAVIFDVRQNGGGEPSMVQFLISHFLNPQDDIVINTFVSRDTEFPTELRALRHLPAGARPNVPVYVLTSGSTGSAAEAFAYHLQALGRATIVGETTYGAGNPGGTFLLDRGFAIFVSTGSARNPITETNWEGVGVAPDVDIAASAALDQALALAYTTLAERSDDENLRENWAWAAELVTARLGPMSLSTEDAIAYVGTYGPRHVTLEDGTLIYRRGEQAPLTLIPLAHDRFVFEELEDYRITFQRDGTGAIISITLQAQGRPPSLSDRDQ